MGVILMLTTIGGLLTAFVLLIIAFLRKIGWLKKFVGGGILIWFVFYAAMLFGFSFLSEEKTLAFDEPKEFCGFYFDCHLHASVSGVRQSKIFGGRTASGEFYIVKVKVFSDAKREPLALITPKFTVVDASGRRFESAEDLTVALPKSPFEEKIPAGGTIGGEIAFDLPADASDLRLDIREGYGIDHAIEAVLVDDEDSIWHKRNFFKLETSNATAKK